MSDEDIFDDIDAEEEGRKFSKKKLILFIGLPALVIIIGVVAARPVSLIFKRFVG